mmetsp:Transcript_19271/g.56005  ORF Transcript_19271/g.56005 Transcript_19271/m.56005 type:complete len:431 (+) Transcript_19271:57-1349(+)
MASSRPRAAGRSAARGAAWLGAVLLAFAWPSPSAGQEAAGKRQRPPPPFPPPPDVRPPGCYEESVDPEGRNYSDMKVSIIIPYRNEKWEHIKGSLESILYYTPRKYLSEIMFVSDGNGPDTIYINELQGMSKLVTVFALPPPGVGLIEAKMRAVGAVAVRTNVLMFLEPHIRVNRVWLQPLLRRLRVDPKTLAMPQLDLIPPTDFGKYYSGTPGQWRFEWNLNLAFTNPMGIEPSSNKAYPSAGTSGGIFAIRKDWWDTLGFYDYGMIGWGGDHVEATFKVWRCGGRIEVVPCSRIGHMFREAEQRPYAVPVERVVQNYNRMAATWFEGEYLEAFYKVKPEARAMQVGNISEQLQLKERLHCKDMAWYLDHVDHELKWEKDHICIPGCNEPECCEGEAAYGRSTLDRVMPDHEYRAAVARSKGAREHEEL